MQITIKTQIEHVLVCPDMYISPIKNTTDVIWILEENNIILKEVTYNPGLKHLITELIVNCRDHFVESKIPVKKIDVIMAEDSFTIKNDGSGIYTATNFLRNVVWV